MLTTILFLIILSVSVFVEAVFFPYPLVFITLATYFFFKKDIFFFMAALLFAVFFDTLRHANPQGTALFLSLFLLFLYIFERVFAVLDARLYVLFVFMAAEGYRLYAGYPFDLITTIIAFILLMALGIFISRRKEVHV